MKDNKSVEEIVNGLTEEQKNEILKADKTGVLLVLLNMVLVIVGMGLLVIDFLKTPKAYLYFDGFIIKIVVVIVGGIVLSLAEYFIIKKKVPRYDDKVCRFIKKSRKNK